MFLTPADSLSPNPDRLIRDAKQVALGWPGPDTGPAAPGPMSRCSAARPSPSSG